MSDERAVARLDPDLLAALADAFVSGDLMFAAAQGLPEGPVGGALPVSRIHKHGVVPPLDLFEAVAEDRQEIRIGSDDLAGEIELDQRV